MESIAKFPNKLIHCSLIEKGAVKPYNPENKKKTVPQWDTDRCIKCGLCYVYCPDGAIYKMDDGFFTVKEQQCKGCGICHRECWFGVISMVEEE